MTPNAQFHKLSQQRALKAELGLNAWNIKRIMGKSIPISDDTYLAGLKLREDFIKLSNVLRLKPATVNNKVGNLRNSTETRERFWKVLPT